MSWRKFDKLTSTEQKEVLKQVFRKTGLMYSVGTKSIYYFKNEYYAFDSVKMFVDEAMQEVL